MLQTKTLRGISPRSPSMSTIRLCGMEIAMETFLSQLAMDAVDDDEDVVSIFFTDHIN